MVGRDRAAVVVKAAAEVRVVLAAADRVDKLVAPAVLDRADLAVDSVGEKVADRAAPAVLDRVDLAADSAVARVVDRANRADLDRADSAEDLVDQVHRAWVAHR